MIRLSQPFFTSINSQELSSKFFPASSGIIFKADSYSYIFEPKDGIRRYFSGLERDKEILYIATKVRYKGITHILKVKDKKRVEKLSEELPELLCYLPVYRRFD